MFQLNKFITEECLCLFMAELINGQFVYYIVDERQWHNAVVHAIESFRKAPRYTSGVYSFTNQQKALEKVFQLLEKQKAA